MHLLRLQGQGVGIRQAARLAGLSPTLVFGVRTGRIRQIRADTQARILAVPAILAHGQTVTGWRTWRLIGSLEKEGFTPTRIAAMLGARGARQRLRFQKKKLTVHTVLLVRSLYRQVNAEGPDGPQQAGT